jgi:DNA-directed RNA polymerase specialized sigma24 family protein
VEQALVQRSELAVALVAIRALRRADREALLLRVVGELDYNHIAALMHTSEEKASLVAKSVAQICSA